MPLLRCHYDVVQTARHIDELDRHGSSIETALRTVPLDRPVASCPGWDVRELIGHLGMVHRWAAEHVRGGLATYPAGSHPAPAKAPDDGLTEWFRSGLDALVSALRAAPDDLEAFTFLPNPGSARAFWARRQAHETVIHEADLLSTTGRTPEIDTELAVDGIAELLEGFFARRGGKLLSDPPLAVRVAPSDDPVSWLVEIGPEHRSISRGGSAAAQCTLHGAAADLYLFLWNRTPSGEVVVDGDERAVELWRRLARVRWS